MLADTYGSPLMDCIPTGERLELVIDINECPKLITNLSDTLTVSPTKNGHRIETDPITCDLDLSQHSDDQCNAFATIEIHQAQMNATQLGYHLWLVSNRMLLLLDSLLVHIAAIEHNEEVNLFCGHKGAGKSTLSVFLAQAGAKILTEDHAILRRKNNEYLVSGCTSRMRVTANTEDFLLPNQLLHDAIQIGDMPKKEFFAEQFFSSKPYIEYKPKRLFLNHVGQTFSVQPLNKKEALLKMVDRTANMYRFADQNDYASFFGFLAEFVNNIDCYSLELSPDLSQLPLFLDWLNRNANTKTEGQSI